MDNDTEDWEDSLGDLAKKWFFNPERKQPWENIISFVAAIESNAYEKGYNEAFELAIEANGETE